MNYIGSKHSLLDFIGESVEKITNDKFNSVCDIFAGTGAVGKYFKKKGKRIVANDIQYYSYVLNRNYIGNHKPLKFDGLNMKQDEVIEYLNNLNGIEGFIYKNYCLGGDGERQYFSNENVKKCDAIRVQIEQWKNGDKINEDEYYFLLATLIENIDKVANTASVYGAYLKKLKKSAQKTFELKPAVFSINDNEHIVFNKNANEIIDKIECDVLYLDPPYNHRQYNGNYHLIETIAMYDNPEVIGKTGMRQDKDKSSSYCSRTKVKNAFHELIKKTKAKYIFLSYNNEGLLSLNDIKEIMSEKGEYGVFEKKYNRFKADKNNNRNYKADSTIEYLHYVKADLSF